MRHASALIILAFAALLAACGEGSTIKPSGAEQSVIDVVSRQTDFRPTDVHCPSDVEAKVGGVFNCQFSGPEGRPYTARMEILKVEGERVVFQVNSRPSGN